MTRRLKLIVDTVGIGHVGLVVLCAGLGGACSSESLPIGGGPDGSAGRDGGTPDTTPVDLRTDALRVDAELALDSMPLVRPDQCAFYDASAPENERLYFATRDKLTEVVVQRVAKGRGSGHSAIYELLGLGVKHGGRVRCLGDTAVLDYENSHHNWIDTARATDDAGQRYEVSITFQPEGDPVTSQWVWTFTLRAYAADGHALFEPVTMELVAGRP